MNERYLPRRGRQRKGSSQIFAALAASNEAWADVTVCSLSIFLKILGLRIRGSCDRPYWFSSPFRFLSVKAGNETGGFSWPLSRIFNDFVSTSSPLFNSFLLEIPQAVPVYEHTLTDTCKHPSGGGGGGGGRICHSNEGRGGGRMCQQVNPEQSHFSHGKWWEENPGTWDEVRLWKALNARHSTLCPEKEESQVSMMVKATF